MRAECQDLRDENCRGSPLWLPAVIGRGEKYFAFFVIFGLDPKIHAFT